ncbi:hypothetical protein CEXT_71871 [Caerostris extrusa]|uniref:Secreted protein n=1 Tax=Caerostris extrusa TaxID=172846 RepID=A0AAV4Q7F8_CAEEX|nr:hypothetical protein CEXT_71871 [Caerostris extrusa]
MFLPRMLAGIFLSRSIGLWEVGEWGRGDLQKQQGGGKRVMQNGGPPFAGSSLQKILFSLESNFRSRHSTRQDQPRALKGNLPKVSCFCLHSVCTSHGHDVSVCV